MPKLQGTWLRKTPTAFLQYVVPLVVEQSAFEWSNEEDFSLLRGGSAMTRTISWQQGEPEIVDFDIDDIEITFFSDAEGTTEIESSDDDYNIGDETLSEIITLENFVDNSDGTGTVDVMIDPSDIDATELMADRNIYILLSVSQNI